MVVCHLTATWEMHPVSAAGLVFQARELRVSELIDVHVR